MSQEEFKKNTGEAKFKDVCSPSYIKVDTPTYVTEAHEKVDFQTACNA